MARKTCSCQIVEKCWRKSAKLMKAKLLDIAVCDPNHLQAYFPDDLTEFCASIEMSIGPVGGRGGDYFRATACSPSWFHNNILLPRKQHETHEQIVRAEFGRHFIFFATYDEDEIKWFVSDFIDKQSGSDWPELSGRLARYFQWEFEDYVVLKA